MSENKACWKEIREEQLQRYRQMLDAIDPNRAGLFISCPGCSNESWVLLPENPNGRFSTEISCPRVCGTFGKLELFKPRPGARESADTFDTLGVCRVDGTEYATNGVVARCPLCAIENCRQVFSEFRKRVLERLNPKSNTDDCADMLAQIMSRFDGLMRAQNRIAVWNVDYYNQAHARGEADHWAIAGTMRDGKVWHPSIMSFQDVISARDKLVNAGWDMATEVPDWGRFVLIVQKRHAYAHTLGVADEKYLIKSGDTNTALGKKIAVSADDVEYFAVNAEKIVVSYFGTFLS